MQIFVCYALCRTCGLTCMPDEQQAASRSKPVRYSTHPDERQPLLAGRPSGTFETYNAIPPSAPPPAQTQRISPYLTLSLRFYFFVGVLLLLPTVILLILLWINYFQPIPLLLPPHRSPTVLPFWLCVVSASILAPGLLFFELASRATSLFHLFVLASLLVAVPEFRPTHSYLGFLSVLITLLSALWALASSHRLQRQVIPFTVNPDVGAPIIAEIPLSRAQAKWARRFKLFWAVLGCLSVAAVSFLITFDLVLDAADSAFKPIGNLTLVHPRALTKDPVYPEDPADTNPYPVSFRLHLAAPARADATKKNPSTPTGPTALVMADRDVSGFLREMSALPRSEVHDGHLALQRVCFWDRIGYGHSDFVYQPLSVKLQTEALYHALNESSELKGDSTSFKHKNDPSSLGQFMLVSTGYGHLFAQEFAVQHPELVHSFLHIDAETPASWYSDKVSRNSGVRAGYLARYHGPWGSLLWDLAPALTEPLGVTRLLGLLKGKSVVDRILAPGQRGGAAPNDLGGGGWHIKGAGGSNARLLMSSWLERLDANLGMLSPNFVRLSKSSSTYQTLLSKRPVAVLSSFWKIHADLDGWAEEQRKYLIEPAKNSSTLAGWWRVGDRNKRQGGGDEGGPAGICSTEMGVIFCEEAVRKLIAAGQSWNSSSLLVN
ncbi:LOW QUALITY PROTEIN: hypothetical protein BCV70DRAFT_228298 [Testicularia cyperi]|uniref:Uncharacterized protein n=1 Tax=Testicularia cyperi TaxID=1882483 RepID=A0A317XIP7_9BASI|nr:LOW QUALITY PROTEIN: hypothetical protein BCV70DRAFT_228298 [Testicularia cyperi]